MIPFVRKTAIMVRATHPLIGMSGHSWLAPTGGGMTQQSLHAASR
jgi:hypothetical protein